MSGKEAPKNRREVYQPSPWESDMPTGATYRDYPSNEDANSLVEGYLPYGKLDQPINPENPWNETAYIADVKAHSKRKKA
jgi:hypothetical protein